MIENLATVDNLQVSDMISRVNQLEERMKLINMRLQLQFTIPRFEFVIEIDDKPVWTGLDLPIQFPEIFQKYPDEEITISWRSSPMVWI
ncbi:MAG: hypothetical protein B6242_16235 [Anaerolineaceae bacterium 4572_78]|nr:MAG: hypothetical protein B6242_16235 [Anaerolineaceae bacterium 4572_78]